MEEVISVYKLYHQRREGINLETGLIEAALTQSIWAGLSIALIFYILKNQKTRDEKQEAREVKYQEIITTLTDKLDVVDDIRKDIEEIKTVVSKSNMS